MNELIETLRSSQRGAEENLIFPLIADELEKVAKVDSNINYNLCHDRATYTSNVFYLYYDKIISDHHRVYHWATTLYKNHPWHMREFDVYKAIKNSINGIIERINPATKKPWLTHVELQNTVGYTEDVSLLSEVSIMSRGYTDHIAIREDFNAEKRLKSALQSIVATHSTIHQLIKFTPRPTLNDDQNRVLLSLSNYNVTLMRGGAGTGKTHVIIELLHAWKEAGAPYEIIILTPTNMAGENVRMRLNRVSTSESDITISTIHSYAYKREVKHPQNALIIFEEASMYDNILADFVMANYGNKFNCKYLFVGDENQLPPVSRSSLFMHVINLFRGSPPRRHNAPNNIQLVANFRSDDIIVRNSNLLAQSDGTHGRLLQHQNFRFVAFEEMENFINAISPHVHDIENTMFVAYHNADVIAINRLVRDSFYDEYTRSNDPANSRIHPIVRDGVVLDHWQWRIGDRAISLQNMRQHDIYNGSICVVKGFTARSILVEVRGGTGKEIEMRPSKLWPAYCITVHKSQGQEWENVVFCQTRNPMIRQLFYVAITRAKKQFIMARKQSCFDDDIQEFLLSSSTSRIEDDEL